MPIAYLWQCHLRAAQSGVYNKKEVDFPEDVKNILDKLLEVLRKTNNKIDENTLLK